MVQIQVEILRSRIFRRNPSAPQKGCRATCMLERRFSVHQHFFHAELQQESLLAQPDVRVDKLYAHLVVRTKLSRTRKDELKSVVLEAVAHQAEPLFAGIQKYRRA